MRLLDRVEHATRRSPDRIRRAANPVCRWLGAVPFPVLIALVSAHRQIGIATVIAAILLFVPFWIFLMRRIPPPRDYGHPYSRAALGAAILFDTNEGNALTHPGHLGLNLALRICALGFGLVGATFGNLPLIATAFGLWWARKVWWRRLCRELHVALTGIPLGAPLPEPVPFDRP